MAGCAVSLRLPWLRVACVLPDGQVTYIVLITYLCSFSAAVAAHLEMLDHPLLSWMPTVVAPAVLADYFFRRNRCSCYGLLSCNQVRDAG